MLICEVPLRNVDYATNAPVTALFEVVRDDPFCVSLVLSMLLQRGFWQPRQYQRSNVITLIQFRMPSAPISVTKWRYMQDGPMQLDLMESWMGSCKGKATKAQGCV